MRRSEWGLLGVVALAVICICGIYGEARAIVVVPNQVNISASHTNQVLDGTAWGWGNLYGDIIPEQLCTSGESWYSGGQLRWSVTANVMGTFMPHDGTITPKMFAYNLLGDQHSQVGLSTDSITFEDKGEWWEAEFFPGLNVNLGLTTSVVHDIWVESEPDGEVTDYWRGIGNVSINIEHGLITNSSSNFWRTDYNDRPSEWQSQFSFSGIGTPILTKISLLNEIPEPMTAALLGIGTLFFRKRRQMI